MWNRKNFLIFALFLNCVYFLGVSYFVTRQISQNSDQSPMYAWMENSNHLIKESLLLSDRNMWSVLEQLTLQNKSEKTTQLAQEHRIVQLIKFDNNNPTEIIGKQKDIPFSHEQLAGKNTVGFHREKEKLFFSYRLDASPISYLFTQSIHEAQLRMQLTALETDIIIVEKETENDPIILYTSLDKTLSEELLRQINFDNKASEPGHMTLSLGTYFTSTTDLVDALNLKQKMILIKKDLQYQTVSMFDIMILIWTLFCISVAVNFLLFKFVTTTD